MQVSLIIRVIFAAALLVGVIGCSHSSESKPVSLLESTDSITWNILGAEEVIPLPNDMIVNDSSIIVVGLMQDKWLHVYNKTTGKYKGRYVSSGHGPDNLVNPSSIRLDNDSMLLICDPSVSGVKLYNGSDFNYSHAIDFPEAVPVVEGVYPQAEGKYLVKSVKVIDGKPTRLFCIVDQANKEVLSVYDNLEKPFDDEPLLLLSQSSLSVSPDGKHFVMATISGGAVEVFEIEDENIELNYSNLYFPVETVESNGFNMVAPDSKIGFTSVCAANDCWFASYSGTPSEHDARRIGVWDWDGNLLRSIVTDKIILKLAPSNESELIYGFLADADGNISLGTININNGK